MITIRIKELIKQKGTTMAEVAKALGVSAPAFTTMCKGNINLNSIERIAAALGVEPFELFVTREEIEEERKRRMARLAVPSATVVCPCCGEAVCIRLTLDA